MREIEGKRVGKGEIRAILGSALLLGVIEIRVFVNGDGEREF